MNKNEFLIYFKLFNLTYINISGMAFHISGFGKTNLYIKVYSNLKKVKESFNVS